MSHDEQFSHHGREFIIEADSWPDEESAAAAIIDLQMWVLRMDAGETERLHAALEQEREALVHEARYDAGKAPLPAVREAQRQATAAGMQGAATSPDRTPTVTLEACQVSQT